MSNPPVGDAPASRDAKANDGQAGQTSIQARSAALHDFADHSMSRGQARDAVQTDLETLTRLRGHEHSTALGTMGRIAESQRAYGAALAQADPAVSDQALGTSKLQNESIVRAQTAYRQSPEGIAAAPQADRMREAVRVAEVQHDAWRAGRSYEALGPTAAEVANSTPKGRAASAPAARPSQKQQSQESVAPDGDRTASNSMRSAGDANEKRRAIPPLEDRFNVFRTGLIEKEYRFRDQAGKVAFTDKLLSINSTSESPAAIKAMVDRAAERGWETVRLKGSPEFVRQGWIAANAQGIKAVGHTPTPGDREAVAKERARLDVGRAAEVSQRPAEGIARIRAEQGERSDTGPEGRSTSVSSGQRQLAAAIEKALTEGKVSPEIRGQVRDMLAAEGARRMARGDRFKVPVYDARAPRAHTKTISPGPQRLGDRERSR